MCGGDDVLLLLHHENTLLSGRDVNAPPWQFLLNGIIVGKLIKHGRALIRWGWGWGCA